MGAFKYRGPPKTWPQIMVLRRIWRAAAKLRELHQPHFERIGMPIGEFDLLSALGNTGGLRMRDLAEAMITTAPNVTRVCSVMEEKGLVKRQRSEVSDREVVARLTPAGEKRFEQVFPQTVNYSAAILDTGLTHKELETLASLLDKLLANVQSPDSKG
jgi:MarR family 2-MHQ and catechol resistance regulon transcriptional repressor